MPATEQRRSELDNLRSGRDRAQEAAEQHGKNVRDLRCDLARAEELAKRAFDEGAYRKAGEVVAAIKRKIDEEVQAQVTATTRANSLADRLEAETLHDTYCGDGA